MKYNEEEYTRIKTSLQEVAAVILKFPKNPTETDIQSLRIYKQEQMVLEKHIQIMNKLWELPPIRLTLVK
jgi:CRISPR/Cas system Type II protein with McrA/HNH and RuvC-like nuclease domain